MTQAELSRLLADLTDTTRRLNQASDTINEIIDATSRTLHDMQLGLEVWLDAQPLTSRISKDDPRIEEQLGFAKTGSDWTLSVRTVEYTPDAEDPYGGKQECEIAQEPLRDCSRRLRIKALPLLPDLLAALKQE